MPYIDEFHGDHDRSMKRLLARLALYADEPFPTTDNRLQATDRHARPHARAMAA